MLTNARGQGTYSSIAVETPEVCSVTKERGGGSNLKKKQYVTLESPHGFKEVIVMEVIILDNCRVGAGLTSEARGLYRVGGRPWPERRTALL